MLYNHYNLYKNIMKKLHNNSFSDITILNKYIIVLVMYIILCNDTKTNYFIILCYY